MPTIAETWLERGRAEGRVEGRAEEWLEAERHILIRLVERRFGSLPALYRARIAADSEMLLHWSEQVLSAQRLQDIFEVLQ